MPDGATFDRSKWSIAKHYANAETKKQRRAIELALLPHCSHEEFVEWVVSSMPWRFFARPDQIEPEGDWTIWVLQAGRGAGKTRAGAEWAFEQAMEAPNRIVSVVSPTFDDLKKVTFGGPSGLLAICDRHPSLVKSITRGPWEIVLHNGSKLQSFTAEAYERLRGPQHHAVWFDEAAGAARVATEVFEQIMFGLRLGTAPRLMITSTPKPIPLFKMLAQREGDGRVIFTRAATKDNVDNLSTIMVEELENSYGGTRLGRQELSGELLTDVPGALWTPAMLQWGSVPDRFDRIVVAIDPSGASDEKSNSDEIGIVTVGVVYGAKKADDRYFVLQDATLIGSPRSWARAAIHCYEKWEGDRIVAEANFGGAMVESTIRNENDKVPVRMVRASRGKAVRAEPVAALYEQGRVFHCGHFEKLEDQMCSMTASGYVGEGSPDRMDALVWAISDLMEKRRAATPPPRVLPKVSGFRGRAG